MNSTLIETLAGINKSYGTDTVRFGLALERVPRIPFTSVRANYITYGGIPIGRSTEMFGPENGGKSTTALDLVGQAQKQCVQEHQVSLVELKKALEKKMSPKDRQALESKLEETQEYGPRSVLYVDTEHTLDYAWAEKLGVDINSLLVLDPKEARSAEEILQATLDLVDTGAIKLLVIDSIPMLVPQTLVGESLEKKSYGGIAGVLTQFANRMAPKLAKYQTAMILINQVREDLSNPYNMFRTPGGKAVKHLASVRLYVRKGPYIDADNKELKASEERPYGNIVELQVIKTKVFPPDRRVGSYTLHYEHGIDRIGDLLLMGAYLGRVEQAGAMYTLPRRSDADDELKFRGRAAALAYLRSDKAYLNWFEDDINSLITQ